MNLHRPTPLTRLLPALPLALACAFGPSHAVAEAPKPNVLLIMTDDLNCDLGAYGHPLVKTPHLDRLAEQGMLFQNAFCNFPLCGPSRASFMTGLYSDQNGVTRLRRLFRHYVPSVTTLSQHFIGQGYIAARVGKIYHYDNPRGIGSHGHDDPSSWNTRLNPRGRDKEEEHLIFSLKPGAFGATLSWLAAEGEDEEQTDGMVASESIKLLQQYAQAKQPFFLATGFYKPHTPFVAPKKYFDLYDPSEIEVPTMPRGYLNTIPEPARRSITTFPEQVDLDPGLARQAIHAYYATISFLDAQIGRLLAALDEFGLRDNTIVVFGSDHGYHMGEHGHFQKNTLFENSARVPLIISYPHMKKRGVETEGIAEMIDFYRTITDLAGLPPPPDYVQGLSLRPTLEDPSSHVRQSALTQRGGGYTVRTLDYRYTKWNSGDIELYNRRDDPGERINLASRPEVQPVIRQLDALLDQRVAEAQRIPESLHHFPPHPDDRGVHKTYPAQ